MGLKSSIISREVCTATTLEEGSGDGGDDSHRATSLEDVPQSPGMHLFYSFMTRHRNFSRETGKREICRREISHGKIRREKREIVKSKIRVFWPKLK